MQIERLVLAQESERGANARDERCQESGAGGEREYGRVHADFVSFGEAMRYEPQQDAAEDGSGGDADQSGSPGEQHGLSEKLADDGGSGCAERCANGEFAGAGRGTREKEPGDVGRCDEEDEGDDSEEHIERLAQRASGELRELRSVEGPVGAVSKRLFALRTNLL